MPSVTRTTNRTRARRGAAEQQVLTAVEELLAEGEAFTTLGVARIAERAGIARSSFYVHFPDKTELLMRLTASATDKLFEVAEAWVVNDEATYADLQTTAAAVLGEYRRHGALLTAFAEVAEPTTRSSPGSGAHGSEGSPTCCASGSCARRRLAWSARTSTPR